MARRYYSSTAVATTLSGNVNNSTTSISVTALSGYPASQPWTAIIDPDTASEEVVTVTAVSGTTLTVTRGVDGTSAVSHNAGAVFRHGVSGRDFDEANAHVNTTSGNPHSVTASEVGAVANSLVDAAGDLLVGSADNTVGRLALGSNGHVLTADTSGSGVAKVKWAAPTGKTYTSEDITSGVSWTVPTGVTLVDALIVGGGAGGGGGSSSGVNNTSPVRGGGGGGSGGMIFVRNVPVSGSVDLAIGAGGGGGAGGGAVTGTASAGGSNGSNGGNTTFADFTSRGGARAVGATGGPGGTFASNSTGLVNLAPGGYSLGADGGNGGSSGGSGVAGGAGPNPFHVPFLTGAGQGGGSSNAGSGTAKYALGGVAGSNTGGGISTNASQTGSTTSDALKGADASTYGAGGGGGGSIAANSVAAGTGGNGAQGFIRVWYWV